MKVRIAAFCCLLVLQSSVVSAGPPSNMGPLRRASCDKTTWTMRSDSRAISHQDDAAPAAADTRSWAARHPVWTGALVGFAAGFLITYAIPDSHKSNELFDMNYRADAALVFGGISAGVGALAGWGIGRSQHDGYHDRARTPAR